MRRETVHLVRQAVSEGRHAYVLVHNRFEGNVGECAGDGAGTVRDDTQHALSAFDLRVAGDGCAVCVRWADSNVLLA
jgi:hypothetical protein